MRLPTSQCMTDQVHSAPRDYDKLVSRAWIDGQGKVHYAKGVKSGRKGCGSTPRSLDNVELYTRAQKLAHLYARDYDAYYLD